MERTQVHKIYLVTFKRMSTFYGIPSNEEFHCFLWAKDWEDARIRFTKHGHPGLQCAIISIEEAEPGPNDSILDTF